MDAIFECFDEFMVRIPARSVADDLSLRFGAGAEDRDVVEDLMADGFTREAVTLSSPSLASAADALGRRESTTANVTRSLFRYANRMSHRATPFGLMAGVALGGFGPDTRGRVDGPGSKVVLADRVWLEEVLDRYETEPDVLTRCRVRTNNMCVPRGDRVEVTVRATADEPVWLSVRNTPLAASALRHARVPVYFTDLCDRIAAEFPVLTRDQVVQALTKLVRATLLLTDLRPASGAREALRWAGDRVPRLRSTIEAIHEYAAEPVGGGAAQLARLQHDTGSSTPVHVDLAMRADARLPWQVAREIERAVTVLWRLSGTDTVLSTYFEEFLERYSYGELVPVKDLLDPQRGLGAPAGYSWPPGHRQPPVDEPWTETWSALLGTRVMAAAIAGEREIVLSDEDVDALATEQGEVPSSLDVFVSVFAANTVAVDAGEFTLALGAATATRQAGSAWGRFGQLLDISDTLAKFVDDSAAPDDLRLPVQLSSFTSSRRGANVDAVPQVLKHSLPIGQFGDTRDEAVVDLDDVYVHADRRRFHLVEGSTGRPLRPMMFNALNVQGVPNMTRLLHEIPLMGVRPVRRWDWGPFAQHPFLPAVRYGRTILSPARWRLTRDLLGPEGMVRSWQDRWRVPRHVRIIERDQHIALDLDNDYHRRQLLDELSRKETVLVRDDPAAELGVGWLTGPKGGYEAEIVAALRAVHRNPVRAPVAALREQNLPALPVGNWISARLYCSLDVQDTLIRLLGAWATAAGDLVESWFFIRYSDEATHRPHIRLRVRHDEKAGFAPALAALQEKVAGLIQVGLVGDMTLNAYRPEVERYGGEAFIGRAERFFHADSRLSVERLTMPNDPLSLVPDVVELVRALHGGDRVAAEDWMVSHVRKDEALHRTIVQSRRRALAMVREREDRVLTEAEIEWSQYLAEYATALRADGRADVSRILLALMHMHCNRRLRPGGMREGEVHALTRAVFQADRDRRRAGR